MINVVLVGVTISSLAVIWTCCNKCVKRLISSSTVSETTAAFLRDCIDGGDCCDCKASIEDDDDDNDTDRSGDDWEDDCVLLVLVLVLVVVIVIAVVVLVVVGGLDMMDCKFHNVGTDAVFGFR